MARDRVARTRLTDEQYAQLEKDAREAGVNGPGEFLRLIYLERRSLIARLETIERRQLHVETEVAEMWKALKDAGVLDA